MTDNDIIKALECLFGYVDCRECPYSPRYEFPLCQQQVAKDTLDLITRQQAENENLKVENQSLRGAANSLKMHYEEAQAKIERLENENTVFGEIIKKQDDEISTLRKDLLKRRNLEESYSKSVKQFDKRLEKTVKLERAEAVKEFAERLKHSFFDNCYESPDVDFDYFVDKLVKEMVGEKNG